MISRINKTFRRKNRLWIWCCCWNSFNTGHLIVIFDLHPAFVWFRIDCMCAQIILKTWALFRTEKCKQPTYIFMFFFSLPNELPLTFCFFLSTVVVAIPYFSLGVSWMAAVGTFGIVALFCMVRVSDFWYRCELLEFCGVCLPVCVCFLILFSLYFVAFVYRHVCYHHNCWGHCNSIPFYVSSEKENSIKTNTKKPLSDSGNVIRFGHGWLDWMQLICIYGRIKLWLRFWFLVTFISRYHHPLSTEINCILM